MGLALLSAVLGGLDAPAWAWIVVLVLALLAFVRAYALHVKEGVDHPVPADSSASPTANGRVYGNAANRQAIAEAAEDDDRKALVREMDNMIREGMGLASEPSVPVQPEKTANGWKIEGGGPSAEQQGKADAFRQRAGELLEQRNPALLADYSDGCNDYIRKEREVSMIVEKCRSLITERCRSASPVKSVARGPASDSLLALPVSVG